MSQSIAIGMIGYKFMGKAHSNAYRQISQFFDLPLKPRLKTISGRDKPMGHSYQASPTPYNLPHSDRTAFGG